MGLTIRDARALDAPAIAELLGQLDYPTDSAAVAGRLERLVIVGDRVIVAELDEQVVGLAHLHVSPAIEHEQPAAKLGALVVHESRRGEGIGRALVEAVEAEARARRCRLVYLTSAERRDGAHAFYRGAGFDETGRRFAKELDYEPPPGVAGSE
jgi:GNAT superfamily N-acetyltransferase